MNFYTTNGRRRTFQITVAREVFIGCRVIASGVAKQNFIGGSSISNNHSSRLTDVTTQQSDYLISPFR